MRIRTLLLTTALAFTALPALAEDARDHWRDLSSEQRDAWKANHPEAAARYQHRTSTSGDIPVGPTGKQEYNWNHEGRRDDDRKEWREDRKSDRKELSEDRRDLRQDRRDHADKAELKADHREIKNDHRELKHDKRSKHD